jgi:hypothetical protein
MLLFTIVMMQTSSSFMVYGQTTTTADTATTDTAPTTGGQNTFSAKGSIDSLVIKDGTQQQQPSPNEQTSYVLDGKWKLEVVNENVTDFGSKFTMVHLDGTNRH